MKKVAQERGYFNKLREKYSPTGNILEVNPEIARAMVNIRKTDEKIREIATGMKGGVKSARQFVNKRDYLAAASNYSAFHERCRLVSAHLAQLVKSFDLKGYDLLLSHFSDEEKESLFGYDPNKEVSLEDMPSRGAAFAVVMKKEAGLSDWYFKMTDPTGFAATNPEKARAITMKTLEKRFNIKFIKQLRTDTNIIAAKTEHLSSLLLAIFKRLATALATRRVDQYIALAKEFVVRFDKYHEEFVRYYKKNIEPLKEQHQRMMAEKQALTDKQQAELQAKREQEREQQAQPFPATYETRETQAPGKYMPPPNQPLSQHDKDVALNKLQRNPEDDMPEVGNTPIPLTTRKSNNEFLNRLEVLAMQDNPIAMISEMLSYSASLEDEQPEESLKILAIAEGLVEELNKTADKKKDPKDPKNILKQFLQDKPQSDPNYPAIANETTPGEPPPLA